MLRRLRNNTQTLALRERILKGAVSNFITQRRARSDFAPPSRHREPAATLPRRPPRILEGAGGDSPRKTRRNPVSVAARELLNSRGGTHLYWIAAAGLDFQAETRGLAFTLGLLRRQRWVFDDGRRDHFQLFKNGRAEPLCPGIRSGEE
jgi:hypothetical protein